MLQSPSLLTLQGLNPSALSFIYLLSCVFPQVFKHSKSTKSWARRFWLPSRILCFWNFSDESRHCRRHLKRCEAALQQTQRHKSLGSLWDYRAIEAWDERLKIWGADFFGPKAAAVVHDVPKTTAPSLKRWVDKIVDLSQQQCERFWHLNSTHHNFCKVLRDLPPGEDTLMCYHSFTWVN